MNTIELLKTKTNKILALALTGVMVDDIPESIWEVDESDIYTLLEERTNKFEPQKVALLLPIFYKMNEYFEDATGRCEVLRKEIAQYQSVINNKYAEFERFWDEHGVDYDAGKIVSPPKPNKEYYELVGYIEDARMEIDNITYKQELYRYAIDVLCSKLQKSTQKEEVLKEFIKTYPNAEYLFKACQEVGLLDESYQPAKRYIETQSDKAYLADLIGKHLKIQHRWKFFKEYWGNADYSNLISKKDNIGYIPIRHQMEIDTLFNKAVSIQCC